MNTNSSSSSSSRGGRTGTLRSTIGLFAFYLLIIFLPLICGQIRGNVRNTNPHADVDVDDADAYELPSQLQQRQLFDLETNVFRSSVLLTVSSDILEDSMQDVARYATLFVDSYNQVQDDPTVCDPLGRRLGSVLSTSLMGGGGGSSDTTTRRERQRRIQATRPSRPPLLQSPNTTPSRFSSFTRFLIDVSGSCSGCTSDPLLFADVSNRRRQRQLQHSQLDRRQIQGCPCRNSEIRGPSTDEVLDRYRNNLLLAGFDLQVFSLSQVTSEQCPAPRNDFQGNMQTVETSFIMKVGPPSMDTVLAADPNTAINDDAAYYDTLALFTADNGALIAEYYNQFVTATAATTTPVSTSDQQLRSSSFCDPFFRQITTSALDINNPVIVRQDVTVVQFSNMVGTCRGCASLFGDEVYVESPSAAPSSSPLSIPSSMPSAVPSSPPMALPSSSPILPPLPSSMPSPSPLSMPSSMPSSSPLSLPSSVPSSSPLSMPSSSPLLPSSMPSPSPLSMPSSMPSSSPLSLPLAVPSSSPLAPPPLPVPTLSSVVTPPPPTTTTTTTTTTSSPSFSGKGKSGKSSKKDSSDDRRRTHRKKRQRRLGGQVVFAKRKLQVDDNNNNNNANDDLCWCNVQATTRRVPTKEEFENFITDRFVEIMEEQQLQ